MPRKPIPQEKLELILEAHKLGMSLPKAAEHSGAGHSTVANYWKAAGLEPHNAAPLKLDDVQKEQILAAYGESVSYAEAAKACGTTKTTVKRVWKEHGLESSFEPTPKASDEVITKILEAHDLGMSTIEAAAYAGSNTCTVRKYWKEDGRKPHNAGPVKFDEEQKRKMLEAHELKLSIPKAAEYADVSTSGVSSFWKANDLAAHNPARPTLTEEQRELMRDAHEKGFSLNQAAELSGASAGCVLHAWRNEGRRPNYRSGSPDLSEEQKRLMFEAHEKGM